MGRYPDGFLEQLRSKVDIVDLISSYVNIQKKGRDYWACCPFHNEKTPSFQIRREYQYYRCFGCGKSGNIFNFIMDYENVTFSEAVEILAKRTGLAVPEPVEDSKAKKERELREKIIAINREAARFYYDNLSKPEGALATEYFSRRGLTARTVKKFGMGYSCDFTSLPKHLMKIGFDAETLLTAGIVSKSAKGDLIDFFGCRVTIPIISAAGKVIGFTARQLKDNPDFAKYKNTTTTPVFNKGKNLFGINLYKKYRQGSPRSLILVEGHMDVISLHQAGIENAVASMGTMLSLEQCREIKKYADIVYVSYDGDSAGQHATLRGLDMLKEQGLVVKVVCLKDNLDPDDFINKFGKEAYLKLLDEALPLEEYKLRAIESGLDLSVPEDRIKYARLALSILNAMDEVERSVYSQEVSERCKLDINTLMESVEPEEVEQPPERVEAKNQELKSSDVQAELFIVSAFIYGKGFIDIQKIPFIREIISNEELRNILDVYWDNLQKGNKPVVGDIYNITTDSELANEVLSALDSVQLSEQEEYFNGCIKKLINVKKSKELTRLTAELLKETDIAKKEELKNQIKLWTNFQAKF